MSTLSDTEHRQHYAAALRAMCQRRGIAPTGYALAALLRSAGYPVHANTLDKHLRGERSPRGSTVEKVLRGLSASDVERALLLTPGPGTPRPPVLSWRDALARDLDKGRETEEVLWWYQIGLIDQDDVCIEQRRTVVGPEGLRAVSFGPGQLGGLVFDMLDTSALGLQVQAHRHSPTGELHPVTAVPHVIQVEPGDNRYGIVVRLGELIKNETLVWTVRYRWPGLWRSLRLKGTSTSNFNFSGRPAVTKTTVELVVPASEFGDLKLVRLVPDSGTIEQTQVDNEVRIRWIVLAPPGSLSFHLNSARHARTAPEPGA
jgi:hypothetical protein